MCVKSVEFLFFFVLDNMEESNSLIPNSDAVEVQVRVEFLNLGTIDTMNEKYEAEVKIISRWEDKKSDFGDKKVFKLEKDKKFEYWHPDLFIENALSDKYVEEKTYTIKSLYYGVSEVTETRIAKGFFWERIELNEFPLDVQELHITVASKLKSKEVKIIKDMNKHSKMRHETKVTFRDQQKFRLFR